MQIKLPSPNHKVESDPNLFMGFMTFVVVVMVAVSLIEAPQTRRVEVLIPLIGLLAVHLYLHWRLNRFAENQRWVLAYVALQGILALIIAWLGGNIGLASALFMALLGEAVGLFGLTRWSLAAGVYYLALLVVVLARFSEWASLLWPLLGLVFMVVFVVMYVTLYMRQNNAREQAQKLAADLEAANRQLAESAAEVEDLTIANERQRMARELHDTLSQGLAGIILQLEAVEAHLSNNRPEKAQAIVVNAMLQARATLADARRAIDDLRTVAPLDLADALRREATRFSAAAGIVCDCQIADLPDALDGADGMCETLVRAAAEGLSNVARHAHATQVKLVLNAGAAELELTVGDNGVGFDPAAVPAGHYGLLGLRERVRLAGGSIEINSTPQQGTTLRVLLPIPEPAVL